jgi:NAD-dependent SIR2 family protein deacetylase
MAACLSRWNIRCVKCNKEVKTGEKIHVVPECKTPVCNQCGTKIECERLVRQTRREIGLFSTIEKQ